MGNGEESFVDAALASFQYHRSLAEQAVAQVTDPQLHVALDENTNSIATIMRHVGGNLRSRWTDFLTTDGEKPWRNRDDEFANVARSRNEVIELWNQGWQCLLDTLPSLTPQDQLRTVTIRGQSHSVPLAIQRSLAHTCYHVGQIVMVARVMAKGNWQTLTIPRGQSAQFNQKVWGEEHR